MRICWIGFHQEGLAAFDAVCQTGAEVVGCFTLTDDAAAKRSGSGSGDYGALCEKHRVPIHHIQNINDERVVDQLRELRLDLLLVIGWSQILHPAALAVAKLGAIGAHASMLPHNRGSAPINWAIINGEHETGNSLIWLADDVDSGAIIDQRSFPITRFDTCATLYEEVARTNCEMIADWIPRLMAGECPGTPQPDTDKPILPRRRPQDGLIDWAKPANQVYDFVRALTRPYPGAFTYFGGTRYTIWKAALLPTSDRSAPGTILGPVVASDEAACGIVVQCESDQLLILELEDERGHMYRGRSLCGLPWTYKGFTSESKTSSRYRRAS